MKLTVLTLLYILIAQAGISQNILVLEKPGTGRNVKYYEKDWITLELKGDGGVVSGQITSIKDFSFILGEKNEILLDEVAKVYTTHFWPSLLQGVCLAAGIPYLVISSINGAVNNDKPIVPSETLIISGSLIAAAILITPLVKSKRIIAKDHWRILILDFTD